MHKTLLTLAFCLSVLAVPAFGDLIVTLTPDNPSPAPGSVLDVSVDIAGALDAPHDAPGNTFSGFGFDVNVSDPSVLQFTGYTLGSLFDENDFSGFFGVDVAAGSNDPGGIDAGDFNLAVLQFTVLGPGESSVHITAADDPADNLGIAYTDPDDPGAAIDSSVDITAVSAAPEPSTGILTVFALAGVLGLGASRSRPKRPHLDTD